jgi:predicted RND superfamily exporter protein
MIPNVAPIALVFGAMGWLGISVDIGAVLTASVALGIAIDDTLHFLIWFRRGTEAGLCRVDAVRNAYDRCATAMFQTTLISALGLSVLFCSSFLPTSRFAVLISLLLVAALLGDLVLLPSILAGPLGRLFSRSSRFAPSIQK